MRGCWPRRNASRSWCCGKISTGLIPPRWSCSGWLVDQAPTAALLNVLTFRPEFVPPWPPRSHLTPLTLNRLERPQVEALITRLARGKRLPPEVVAYIVTYADGVPLYVEELTKALLESALLQEQTEHYRLTGPLTSVAIPATLQDALMARLDPLTHGTGGGATGGGARAGICLRDAAGPGGHGRGDACRTGWRNWSRRSCSTNGGGRRAPDTSLSTRWCKRPPISPCLRRTRQHYHQQVAELVEARFRTSSQTEPELVAHHYTEAGCPAQAIPYWQRAGQQALPALGQPGGGAAPDQRPGAARHAP